MNKDLEITSRYNNGSYLSKNSDWHVEDSPWKAHQVDKIIKRNKLTPTTICEVGCGAGEILRQLSLKSNYAKVDFTGYEISGDAFELCRTRSAQRLTYLKKDLLEDEKQYDITLCLDVFEHVENYMGFVKSLKEKIGFKIFHIPLDLSVSALLRGMLIYNRNSVGHLHYFTPDTAIATLNDCGYEIVDTMYTPSFADLPSKSWKAKLIKLPRLALYKISPKLLSTLIGGVSLMVLAK
ncbi:class I SAM-dependent methyltransferase [Candidatus Pelagibacter bacterium]|nr:class I SAM-dependent methyltransferase [Candidatus Pelagibacter bacterium]